MRIFCLLLAAFFLTLSPNRTAAELTRYVHKYKNVSVSPQQLRNLARYSHLVDYFSSFSYFKPHHKVSPNFIKALILAESNGDRLAVSNKNALGLGQILHTTGRQAAREIYSSGRNFRYIDKQVLRDLRKEDLFDPAINILLTCYLIAKYNHRFDGKLELVVSAWNAGENVDSLKLGMPPPYSETHNLIGKINGYYLYLLRLAARR